MRRLPGVIAGPLHSLARAPGFAATAVVTLALGIGATAGLFTVVDAVLLEPLPFPRSHELVRLWRSELPNLTFGSASYPRFVDWRARNRAFSELGAYTPRGMTLGTREGPERVGGAAATASFFAVLGASPAAGRWFTEEDDRPGAPHVAVLGHGLWQRRFRGDPSIIGTAIVLDETTHIIVGVSPASFGEVWRPEIWIPLAMTVDPADREDNFLVVVGRLRPGLDLRAGRLALDGLAAELGRDYPQDRYTFTAWPLHEMVTDGSTRGLWVLLGATLLLLLIACANVANLLLARAVVEERALAVRASLGASRGQLFAHVVGEAIALALPGAALGLGLAWELVRVFVSLAPGNFPRLTAVGVNGRVVVFAALAAALAGLLAALAPALHVMRVDLGDALRAGQTRGSTARRARAASRWLVATEVALALALSSTAALMMKSLQRLQHQDLGLTRERVLTFSVGLPPERARDEDGLVRFVTTLEQEIRTLPGVRHVGAINMLPIASTGLNFPVGRFGQVGARETFPLTEQRTVTPGYFDAMGMRLMAGRGIEERDRAGSGKVVVINEALARQLWTGRPFASLVGERLVTGLERTGEWREIVGVAGDIRSRRPDSSPAPELYLSYAQVPAATMVYAVRAAGDPAALVAPIRRALAALDARVPMASIRFFDDVVATSTQTVRLLSWLSAAFGALAGLLSILGIYSVMSHAIAQRHRELAVRAAVGASRPALLSMVLGEGLRLSVVGILAGVTVALAVSRLLGSLLFEVSARDPLVLAATAAGLGLVAVAGYWIPALRASRVEPIVALRGA